MPDTEFVLTSERLGFRLMQESDVENLITLDTDPEVRAHFPDGVLTIDQIRERIDRNQALFDEHGFADFAVIDLATGEFAGRAGFGPLENGEIEAGYVFLKKFWGLGLAQESLRALLAWAGRNLGVRRVLAYAPGGHTASFNVMKKSGMRFVETRQMRGVECELYEFSY